MRLAFDIETLGLLEEVPLPEITCVCMCDSDGGVHCFRIWKDPERSRNEQAVLALLDAADTLCGYNAVLFDLEFIRVGFVADVSEDRMAAWVRKCVDPYMCARHISETGGKMQHMLELNGLASKTASGAEAIVMAREDQWEKLLDYCLVDAQLTMALCSLEWIHFTPFLQCKMSARAPPQFRFAGARLIMSKKTASFSAPTTLANESKVFVFCDDDDAELPLLRL